MCGYVCIVCGDVCGVYVYIVWLCVHRFGDVCIIRGSMWWHRGHCVVRVIAMRSDQRAVYVLTNDRPQTNQNIRIMNETNDLTKI